MSKRSRSALFVALILVAAGARAAPPVDDVTAVDRPSETADADNTATGEVEPSAVADDPSGPRYRQWTTQDGVHMLAVDPSASPHAAVRVCDEGRRVAAERGEAACRDD